MFVVVRDLIPGYFSENCEDRFYYTTGDHHRRARARRIRTQSCSLKTIMELLLYDKISLS